MQTPAPQLSPSPISSVIGFHLDMSVILGLPNTQRATDPQDGECAVAGCCRGYLLNERKL
jgi:hypothetical protein